MRTRLTIAGAFCILLGIALLFLYESKYKPEGEARKLFRQAVLVFERRDTKSLNEALNNFTRIIAQFPYTDSAQEATLYTARAYELLGFKRLAYLKYIYILKNDRSLDAKKRRSIQTALARLLIERNRTEEAVHNLLSMLNITQDSDMISRVYTELGHTFLKTAEYDKARRMFEIALSEKGTNEEAILGKARAFMRLGEAHKAFDMYEYFLKYYGSFSPYASDVKKSYHDQLYEKGYELYKQENYKDSANFLSRLIRYFPRSRYQEESLYFLGENYLALNSYGKAISYFSHVLKNRKTSRDEISRIKLGSSYFLLKKYDKAAHHFELYIKSYPKGKYSDQAEQWIQMCARELKRREGLIPQESESSGKIKKNTPEKIALNSTTVQVAREFDEDMDEVLKSELEEVPFRSGSTTEEMDDLIEHENVAEL